MTIENVYIGKSIQSRYFLVCLCTSLSLSLLLRKLILYRKTTKYGFFKDRIHDKMKNEKNEL